MMPRRLAVLFTLVLVFSSLAEAGRMRRDPLTPAETDELREVATEPDKKIKLYIKYARARMLAIEQLRADPKLAQGRGEELNKLIEDLGMIVRELGQNVDEYGERKADLRKVLGDVIQLQSELQVKLRTIKEQGETDPQWQTEHKDYQYVLEDSLEIVSDGLATSREMLDEQNTAFAQAEAEKKQKKKK